jgi:hypothetical protein
VYYGKKSVIYEGIRKKAVAEINRKRKLCSWEINWKESCVAKIHREKNCLLGAQ